ncbi:PREDICTED: DNA-directed RNA polymerase III subunit RPC4, partial [Corvus brachyrhynchos]|uniref:DNA-directed RNA polymerase III subunit RPC4 n=1 Tax=Corvus brachyrhynchos TaxID=85066 RepID=UPI0008167309
LPSIRSRDLTLGGVKKKTFTPNIIGRKIKEEPREDVSVKKEKKERERQRDGHGRGRGRPEVIQSHSIFEQGPAEMMKKKGKGSSPLGFFGDGGGPTAREEKMELDPPVVKVKEEPREEDPKAAQPKGPPGFPRAVSAEELVFLQLPPTLPGQPPTHDSKPIKSELHNEDGQVVVVKQEKSQEAKQAENTCTLADLPEGQVGKLLIRKSGKVQLVLGKVTLDVTMGTPCSFLQELVSVGIGDNRTGEMIVLGHVRHKLVCSPDFEALLEHRHR